MSANRIKIVYAVNEGSFFLSHRLPLAREASARGYDVHVVCGIGTGEAELVEYGITAHPIPFSRSGFNPLKEITTLNAITGVYRDLRPDIVHHVTIKPVLYGTRAAARTSVRAVVNAVPGMGFVFTRRGSLARMRRLLVNFMYRVFLRHPNMRVIFQNSEDMRGFIDHAIVKRAQVTLIRGSGVDFEEFSCSPEPAGPVTLLLVARMLWHKGVGEFVEAARRLRGEHPSWRFLLAGDVDPGNPASIAREDLEHWQAEGLVEWLGHRNDIARLMADSHVVCLPSYREGLPKTLLEAAASGRAMISSDATGCQEVVRDGVTGLVVPIRDAAALTEAMEQLGSDPALRARFGRAAREKAEALFDVEDVVEYTFRVYEELLAV